MRCASSVDLTLPTIYIQAHLQLIYMHNRMEIRGKIEYAVKAARSLSDRASLQLLFAARCCYQRSDAVPPHHIIRQKIISCCDANAGEFLCAVCKPRHPQTEGSEAVPSTYRQQLRQSVHPFPELNSRNVSI